MQNENSHVFLLIFSSTWGHHLLITHIY